MITKRKRKKSRKKRGKERKLGGKRRGAGNRGGRGRAGIGKRGKHKKFSYLGELGKRGFTSVKKVKRPEREISLSEVTKLIEKAIARGEKGEIQLDLEKLGYTKLIGGSLNTYGRKVILKIRKYSKGALEKVKSCGGEIVEQFNK
ncbi:50S ribosomal protein L15 [Nanoarchaeota archaeon]|nr:MAG: 50S ribosomal protein L15 [Nanoarchaeota archaeon]